MLNQLESVRSLGLGATGCVFEARDPATGERYVVKRLQSGAHSPKVIARFVREAALMSRLQHVNIMPIVHVDAEGPDPYFVMPYRDGEALSARSRSAPESVSRVVRVARDIASGLAEAHRVGILHRDLKPANIFVEQQSRRAVLLDFGLAKDTGDTTSLTATGALLGTPAYMAPEQVRGGRASVASDVYSFGVIVMELLLGANPFYDPDILETFRRHLEDAPPRLDVVRVGGVSRELADLVEATLNKTPEARPTAESCRDALVSMDAEIARKARIPTQLSTRPRMLESSPPTSP